MAQATFIFYVWNPIATDNSREHLDTLEDDPASCQADAKDQPATAEITDLKAEAGRPTITAEADPEATHKLRYLLSTASDEAEPLTDTSKTDLKLTPIIFMYTALLP